MPEEPNKYIHSTPVYPPIPAGEFKMPISAVMRENAPAAYEVGGSDTDPPLQTVDAIIKAFTHLWEMLDATTTREVEVGDDDRSRWERDGTHWCRIVQGPNAHCWAHSRVGTTAVWLSSETHCADGKPIYSLSEAERFSPTMEVYRPFMVKTFLGQAISISHHRYIKYPNSICWGLSSGSEFLNVTYKGYGVWCEPTPKSLREALLKVLETEDPETPTEPVEALTPREMQRLLKQVMDPPLDTYPKEIRAALLMQSRIISGELDNLRNERITPYVAANSIRDQLITYCSECGEEGLIARIVATSMNEWQIVAVFLSWPIQIVKPL